jgi:hypothetical protein
VQLPMDHFLIFNYFIFPIMLNKYVLLFLILLAFLGLQAQKLTLEDVVIKRAYAQKSVIGLASLNDGLNYTALENQGKEIVKYSFKTGEKVALVLDIASLKNDSLKAITDYQLSSDETDDRPGSYLSQIVYSQLLYLQLRNKRTFEIVKGR